MAIITPNVWYACVLNMFINKAVRNAYSHDYIAISTLSPASNFVSLYLLLCNCQCFLNSVIIYLSIYLQNELA